MICRYPHIFSPADILPSFGAPFVVLLLAGVVFVIFKWWLTQHSSFSSDVTLHLRPLMTRGELAFFAALHPAAGLLNSHVFVQVPLAAVIDVRANDRSKQKAAYNRIDRLLVDFVLVDKKTMGILVIVELDDRSHSLESRRSRDEGVDRALAEVRIPIIHWIAQARYNTDEIVEQITRTLATT